MAHRQPSSRDDFEIAIICALPLEYDAVCLAFDEFWDEKGDPYGKAHGDPNYYTTGRVGKYHVVLVLLPDMGKVNAASAASSIRSSYRALRLSLLVGICGGVPETSSGDEILLGDVVISKNVVQYDFGTQYPDKFVHKDTLENNLTKPSKDVRSLLAIFQTDLASGRLQRLTAHFLTELQAKSGERRGKRQNYLYPGTAEDRLFQPSYRHKHHISPQCICRNCIGSLDPVCVDALNSSCDDLGCDDRYLIQRKRLETKQWLENDNNDVVQEPAIHIGLIASGDTVMKSGEDRDNIAKKGPVAFEMEGAGVWEEVPCIVVKGVCDYADCHKNKKWQNFAAATAASASKAIIERYILTDKSQEHPLEDVLEGHWVVPFGRNSDFVGRESALQHLLQRIPPDADKDDCQRTALEGLGGVGKTQIALEAAFRVRDMSLGNSVFWVPAVDATSFEDAYREIGKCLKIPGILEAKANVNALVKAALSHPSSGRWLLIIDNADDLELLFSDTKNTSLLEYVPFSRMGSILVTTRNHEAAVRLDIPHKGIISTNQMSRSEAVQLLQKSLKEDQMHDSTTVGRLLDFLAYLPLAIKQAAAYMAKTGITTTRYLEHCQSSDKTLRKLLSKDFEDRRRYSSVKNAIATTWLISFEHISRDNPLAARYLRFLCFLAEKNIPASLLPPAADDLEGDEAIGNLKAYAFLAQRERGYSFDIHRLVRLAMQNWLREMGVLEECITGVIQRLAEEYPFPEHENRDKWMSYLAHAQAALDFRADRNNDEAEVSLRLKIGESYRNMGKYWEAEQTYRHVFDLAQKILSQDHGITLSIMNNLSVVLCQQGKNDEAEDMYRKTIWLKETKLGKEHLSTLNSMNNLALVLASQGKYEASESMHRETLKIRMKGLGEQHFSTLESMGNLAEVIRRRGGYKEAEQMHRQTLRLRKTSLGEQHSDTLANMSNLANVLDADGKYQEARQIHEETLEIRMRVLGKEHPDTLWSISNLAVVLFKLGEYECAGDMHRDALELRTKVLGELHPSTLESMNNVAEAIRYQGQFKQAEQIHRHTMEARTKILGELHPSTLESMNNVAEAIRYQGQCKEAEQMHKHTLELKTKVLGELHPLTLESMNNIAEAIRYQGQFKEAEQMHRHTLGVRTKILGELHPSTLTSMNNVAEALYYQGQFNEAEQMHRHTLEGRMKVLGALHPDTLVSTNNIMSLRTRAEA